MCIIVPLHKNMNKEELYSITKSQRCSDVLVEVDVDKRPVFRSEERKLAGNFLVLKTILAAVTFDHVTRGLGAVPS